MFQIADLSLDYDLRRKAAINAGLGLSDDWVIDARKLTTRIHREPHDGSFRSIVDLPHTATLTPLRLPMLSTKLADLGLTPEA